MEPTRRDFLERAVSASLILGFPAIACRATRERRIGTADYATFDDAMHRVREEAKPGLVIRFPEDDEDRQRLVATFDRLLGDQNLDNADAHEIFCETVAVCADSETVDRNVRDASADENALLVDANGRRIDGVSISAREFVDSEKVLAQLRTLVHGSDLSRLRDRAESSRVRATATAIDALRDFQIGAGTHEELMELMPFARELFPLIVLARAESLDKEERERFANIVKSYVRQIEEDEPGPLLPYGLALKKPSSSDCGSRIHGSHGARPMACGMAVVCRPASRKFVGLLAK